MLIICINKFGPRLPAVPAEEDTNRLKSGWRNYFKVA